MKRISIVLLSIILCFSIAACNKTKETADDIWKDAIYTEDTELGNGKKCVLLEVEAGDKTVTFKINTDKETLGEALVEHNLIQGENGAYGLYVKTVNGITADYDVNQSYWSLCKDGEYMQNGVDSTKISDGEHFELIYTK